MMPLLVPAEEASTTPRPRPMLRKDEEKDEDKEGKVEQKGESYKSLT